MAAHGQVDIGLDAALLPILLGDAVTAGGDPVHRIEMLKVYSSSPVKLPFVQLVVRLVIPGGAPGAGCTLSWSGRSSTYTASGKWCMTHNA